MSHTFYCGAGKEKITPHENSWSQLRGLMDRKFGGVLDDIYVRVIYLKNDQSASLLISFELDKVPCPEIYLECASEVAKVPKDNILLVAVHTHTAPLAGNRVNEGPNNFAAKPPEVQCAIKEYEAFMKDALQRAVKNAVDSAVPAKFGYGYGNSYINVDRKFPYESLDQNGSTHRQYGIGENYESEISRKVYVFRFEDLKGKPLAFFINYPVHCAVLNAYEAFDGKLGISGDIAGRISYWNEEKYAGAVTLWSSGAAGDINPYIKCQMEYPDPKTGSLISETIQSDGYKILNAISAKHYDDICRINRKIKCETREMVLDGKALYSITDGNKEPFKIRLHMMRLGDIYLLGASGELFDIFAKAIRKRIPREIIVVNHDASFLGDGSYIADDETLMLNHARLPGMMHPNQKAGLFMKDFLEKSVELIESLDPTSKDEENEFSNKHKK